MAQPGAEVADVIGRLLVRVYEIHERVISRGGGGLEGIRDAGLLHAAVARPFATFGEVELYPTDFDKAAALFHSLIKSHPSMDGTKRTAFAAAVYFLHERGYTFQRPFPRDDIIRFC
jgi:death on curing protein